MNHPTKQPVLEVRGLCKEFPGVIALDHVDFVAYPGEIHALLGENGAGKSTLQKILGGATSVDAGEILVEGMPVRIFSPLDSRRYGINQVPQDICVVPNLSAAENIHIGSDLIRGSWITWEHIHESALAALEHVGADFDPRTPTWQLSAAQQQLVVIARAIARGGKVLVLDEPTACLGGKDTEKLLNALCNLRQEGMAIIYISHHVNEIYSLSDRVTVLHDGRVTGTLGGEEISTQRVIDLMKHGAPRKLVPVEPIRKEKAPRLLEVGDITDGQRIKPAKFAIDRGEIVGLAGLKGSGRSRLSRMICGADPMQSGSICISGKHCDLRSPADAILAGITYVPESQGTEGLFPHMSPQDNVTIGLVTKLQIMGVFCNDAELGLRYMDAMKRLKLPSLPARLRTTALSGGERQKLLLARGIVMQPKLLILDEPTRGLDATAKADVESAIAELAAEGTAVLWISAKFADIVRICDRALVMSDGKITGFMDPAHGDTFTEEYMLAYATGLRQNFARDAPW